MDDSVPKFPADGPVVASKTYNIISLLIPIPQGYLNRLSPGGRKLPFPYL